MTDHHRDELASAYLDGAASPEEAAQVEADPDLQTRVAALREVRAALRRPSPVDGSQREAALAAAQAAFAEAGEERHDPSPGALPVASPAARWRWSPRTVRVVGAAAVALLLAAAVPLLGQLADDDEPQAARFEETGAAIGGVESGVDRSTDAGTGANDLGPTSSTVRAGESSGGDDGTALAHLGTFPTLDELVAALGAPIDQAAPTPAQPDAYAVTCPSGLGPDDAAISAVVDGEPVVAVVGAPADDGSRPVTVYRTRDCRVVLRSTLP